MKICDFCKNEIDENAKFCPVCGAEQKSEPAVNQPQAAEAAETEVLGAEPFGNSQPEAMPFGAAPVNQNQPPVNSGTYFTPGANVNANPNMEMFNGGVPVQNVAQSKKGKGGKIALIIIGIIAVLVVALIVIGALSGDDSDVSSDPSAGSSQSAEGKTIVGQGVFDETGYTNSALGLRIDCPDGWDVLDSDDIVDFFKADVDGNGKVVDEYGWIYEFTALNAKTLSDIDVQSVEGGLADKLLSHDDWLEAYMENNKEDGDVMSEPYDMTIGSITYKCYDCDISDEQYPVKERVLTYKEGKDIVLITIWLYPEDEEEGVTLDSIMENYFSAIN